MLLINYLACTCSAVPPLTEISWLRGVRERKSLVCKPTLQKVSTTFSALSLVLLRLRRPVASGSVGAVGSATASPVFPVSADVPAQVECSAAAPVPVRRPAADAHRASECLRGSPGRPAASVPARGLAAACARSRSGSKPESKPECAPRCATRRGGGWGAGAGRF